MKKLKAFFFASGFLSTFAFHQVFGANSGMYETGEQQKRLFRVSNDIKCESSESDEAEFRIKFGIDPQRVRGAIFLADPNIESIHAYSEGNPSEASLVKSTTTKTGLQVYYPILPSGGNFVVLRTKDGTDLRIHLEIKGYPSLQMNRICLLRYQDVEDLQKTHPQLVRRMICQDQPYELCRE